MNHACVTEYLQEQSIKVRILKTTEAATWSVLWKRVFLKILQNSQACNFIKNKTLAQVFSCEFWRKEHFFTENLWTTASEN